MAAWAPAGTNGLASSSQQPKAETAVTAQAADAADSRSIGLAKPAAVPLQPNLWNVQALTGPLAVGTSHLVNGKHSVTGTTSSNATAALALLIQALGPQAAAMLAASTGSIA